MYYLSNCTKVLFMFLFFSLSSIIVAQDKPEVTMGGALRFNYNSSSWKGNQTERGGDFGFDVFRVNAKAAYKGLKLNAEYRFYSSGFGGGMLKQGWIQYDFKDNSQFQLGLTQVPFGITTYNSNSWFFSLNYYVGLEDDHDMGLKYSRSNDKWDLDLAFFKNAEENSFGNLSDVDDSRYAYDVGSLGDGTYRNKELNQFNAKVNYKFGKTLKSKLGASAQYGALLNLDTEDIGNRNAFAVHYEATYNKWNLKAQFTSYNYNPEAPDGESEDMIAMTAYGAPYLVASKATLYTIGLNHTFPVEWGPVSSVMVYNDFGYMNKNLDEFEDTMMNDFGFLLTAGSVYTYIDFAAGKNQPWLGNEWTNGLASGNPDAEWEMRFNINIGYYF
ncbi:hypothetical protein [Plebeiibacterium sediminum]|uniref:Phosphate-selective porin O and P n=1 Tax=Plebeiibacterium sediminum TaxID=2992112 RepID=A0AAE3SEU0_9BACT|nr:hypothetical protein [Plebeiobacterium sediminum]MCW3786541.1 hypothetical protein [Plebeiobacterium sediminum]